MSLWAAGPPVGVNGKLYLSSEEGQVYVVKMGHGFEVLATNTLADSIFIATPLPPVFVTV